MTSPRKTSRRDFLKGHSAHEALADLAQRELPPPQSPTAAPAQTPSSGEDASYLIQISRTAMACQFQVYLNAGQHTEAAEAALEALDLVEDLANQLTVYRETSEISRVNRTAADRPVVVEPRLFQLLELAVRLYDDTEGAFDITSAPLSQAWGFPQRTGRYPEQSEIALALQRVGSRWLELCPTRSTIHFRIPGVELNLGSIGKGYALDRCGELLMAAGVQDYLIHGGQSSILACGSRAGREHENRGWTVALRHPFRNEQTLGEIELRDRALGTSGSGNQFFHHRGRRYGHILDPRNGQPAENVLSSSVLAPTAALADGLATAFYVMGPDKALEYCRQHADVSALLICPGPRQGSIHIQPINIDESTWTPSPAPPL